MHKRVKKAKDRYKLALEAMTAEGGSALCAPQRFPSVVVLTDMVQVAPCNSNKVCRIADLHQVRKKAVGAGHGFVPGGMKKVLESRDVARHEISRICHAVRDELPELIAAKVK